MYNKDNTVYCAHAIYQNLLVSNTSNTDINVDALLFFWLKW